MGIYTIELGEEEEKALLTEYESIALWLSYVIHNKARKCIDKIITDYSDKQPSKISEAEKNQIVRDAEVATAAERGAKEAEVAPRFLPRG